MFMLGSCCGAILLFALVAAVGYQIFVSSQSEDPYPLSGQGPRRKKKSTKKRRSSPVTKEKVDHKAKPTMKLLLRLSQENDLYEPEQLRDAAANAFDVICGCLRSQKWQKLRDVMTTSCADELRARVDSEKDHDIAYLDNYSLEAVKLVHFAALEAAEQQSFTAFLRATPKRGEERSWQEFWTFHRKAGGWRLTQRAGPSSLEALQALNRLPFDLVTKLRSDPEAKELLEFVDLG